RRGDLRALHHRLDLLALDADLLEAREHADGLLLLAPDLAAQPIEALRAVDARLLKRRERFARVRNRDRTRGPLRAEARREIADAAWDRRGGGARGGELPIDERRLLLLGLHLHRDAREIDPEAAHHTEALGVARARGVALRLERGDAHAPIVLAEEHGLAL